MGWVRVRSGVGVGIGVSLVIGLGEGYDWVRVSNAKPNNKPVGDEADASSWAAYTSAGL